MILNLWINNRELKAMTVSMSDADHVKIHILMMDGTFLLLLSTVIRQQ
jgi:hypothetical protein